ncbi:MAG: hypothetical protein WC029_15565 [Sulfuricella sp.]
MSVTQENQVSKSPARLKRDESLEIQERRMSKALSADEARYADIAAEAWNGFNKRAGSFADEHSTL